MNWANSNIRARIKVIINPGIALSLDNKQWWDQVKVTPLLRRTIVLNKGIPYGLIGTTLSGGHSKPKSMLGDKALSKKDQKIPKKNITSLNKKSIKAKTKQSTKFVVCFPESASKIKLWPQSKIVKTKLNPLRKRLKIIPYLKNKIRELIKAPNIVEIQIGK